MFILGPLGWTGAPGAPGLQGFPGGPGFTGWTGRSGPTGDTGFVGNPGGPGFTGSRGATGATGFTGECHCNTGVTPFGIESILRAFASTKNILITLFDNFNRRFNRILACYYYLCNAKRARDSLKNKILMLYVDI